MSRGRLAVLYLYLYIRCLLPVDDRKRSKLWIRGSRGLRYTKQQILYTTCARRTPASRSLEALSIVLRKGSRGAKCGDASLSLLAARPCGAGRKEFVCAPLGEMQFLACAKCLFALTFVNGAWGYLYSSTGNLGGMSTTCLNQLNNIFNDRYLLQSTKESQDTRLTLLEALELQTNTTCPPEDQLVNCFWISYKDWIAFDKQCPLFKSQVPLPACSDAAGEAAEGVPSCKAIAGGGSADIQGRRRLLQGPANDQGIATWQYSNGEAAGLQYDAFAPAGSVTAQPPIAQGATGADAAALRIAAEGNEGASVAVGGVAAADAGGCFPGIWTTNAFNDYLHGNLTETSRPKDIGGVNAVGVVSVFIYTILLASLAAV